MSTSLLSDLDKYKYFGRHDRRTNMFLGFKHGWWLWNRHQTWRFSREVGSENTRKYGNIWRIWCNHDLVGYASVTGCFASNRSTPIFWALGTGGVQAASFGRQWLEMTNIFRNGTTSWTATMKWFQCYWARQLEPALYPIRTAETVTAKSP